MIMQDGKKKAVSLIISKLGDKQEKVEQAPTVDNVEQDLSMPLEAAADEILQALETKNAKALVEALKYFMEMCEYKKDEESYVKDEEA